MKKVTITEEELQALLSAPETRHRGFSLVVDMYSQQIYWQLRRMVYSHDDANDLVQNTFIKAWEALDDFRGEAKVSTWLYRIAMYEGLNYIKQEKRKGEFYLRAEDEGTADFLMSKLESDEYFDGDDYERRFQAALLTLPEKQSLVFRMRYYDEMPYEEIAKVTGTSVGALKASYHHAVKKLESLLGEED
ncbi:MAG: RNA polymerase sigma factor [Porphyromonas sp.]|nr:RNA polymerase sigma factor [Porphyromonas sp.]